MTTNAHTAPRPETPLFELGDLRITPAARDMLTHTQAMTFIRRHAFGDFGVLNRDDIATNRRAIVDGARILSAYPIDPAKPCKGFGDNCVWVITEAEDDDGERSATTILLPEEY